MPVMLGILTEDEINRLVQIGAIARSRDEPVIRQTTLELHASEVVWYGFRSPQDRRHQVDPGGKIIVQPGEIVSLVTEESVTLPQDITGTIFPRGRLLALGIWASATHVDYAFHGHLRIIFANIGPHTIALPVGEEIGRLELTRLECAGQMGYRGVNADLRHVNNQSDYLVMDQRALEKRSAALATTWWSLLERTESLEVSHKLLLASMRRIRLSIAIIIGVCLAGAFGLLIWSTWEILRKFLESQLGASAGASMLVLVVVAVATILRKKIIGSLKQWISGDQIRG
jgi:deoxycytidine triphosphate deaminase